MAEAVLSETPARFAVCGLSLGGLVALELVRRAPDRVTRLALMSTSVDPDAPALRAMREATVARVRQGAFDAQIETLIPLLFGAAGRADPAITGLARAMARHVGAERYAHQVEAILNRPDPRPHLATITCPSVVICGAEDVVTPVETHLRIVAGLSGAKLAVIEGGGHLLPLEQPTRVAAELRDWLDTGSDGPHPGSSNI